MGESFCYPCTPLASQVLTPASYFIDKDWLAHVDVATRCPPGSRFYRMPAFALLEDWHNGMYQGTKSAGFINTESHGPGEGSIGEYYRVGPHRLNPDHIPD